MKKTLPPLGPHEENALRLMGFRVRLHPSHLLRLLQLDLVEWDSCSWRLTELGRQRYDSLIEKSSKT